MPSVSNTASMRTREGSTAQSAMQLPCVTQICDHGGTPSATQDDMPSEVYSDSEDSDSESNVDADELDDSQE
jgi:hypothetical protein